MTKLITNIWKKLFFWLLKAFGKQLPQQDIEDIVQEAFEKCIQKYPKTWDPVDVEQIQKLVFVIAKRDVLKKIEKNKNITIEDIDDLESYLMTQEITSVANIPWKAIISHPDLVRKPNYQFILEKIIYYRGECTGKDLYEAIIEEYQEKFDDHPQYDNFRKIKSRMGTILRRILYQHVKQMS